MAAAARRGVSNAGFVASVCGGFRASMRLTEDTPVRVPERTRYRAAGRLSTTRYVGELPSHTMTV